MRYTHFRAGFLVLSILAVVSAVASAQSNVETLQLTFTTIDVPGAGATVVYGINSAGDVVGVYGNDSNSLKHGFLDRAGSFTTLDYPNADSTFATGINDSGLIVGYANFSVRALSFLSDGVSFVPLHDGTDLVTFAYGINNTGYVVGTAGDPSITNGFERRGAMFKNIIFPGTYYYGYATGVNDLGQVVGWTTDGTNAHGYRYSGGTFTEIDFPGANMTAAWAINDKGMIVGWYSNPGASGYSSFAFINGRLMSFVYPGAQTFATGVSALGQVAGQYTNDYIYYHGFVTSPIADVP